MQDFEAGLRTLIADPTHWLIVDPPLADVEFPQRVSRDYLVHNSRVGKNMVWIVEDVGSALERQPLSGCLITGHMNVFCYARAKSSLESEIAAARARSIAMREQISDIVQEYRLALSGAQEIRPGGTNQWDSDEVDPAYFAKLLIVEVLYEI